MKKQDLEKFLDALKDGRWHNIEEIIDKTRIKERKVKLVTSFLQEFQFIQVDKKSDRIRLDLSTRRFLEKLGKIDATSFYEEITA